METTSPSKKTARVNNQENRTIREKNRNTNTHAKLTASACHHVAYIPVVCLSTRFLVRD